MATWEGKPTLASVLKGYTPPTESALADPIIEHIKNIPQKFEENQRHQMDLLARAYPGTTFKEMMLNGDPAAMNELAMQVPLVGMVAYHGTPHNILGKFDISKVGTGEGAQAYGHGMYFAEAPTVAESYKTKLSGGLGSASNELMLNGQPLQNLTDAQRRAYEIVARDGRKNALGTAKDLEAEGFDASHIREALKATKGKEISLTKNEGNLYKVDIPDEYIPNMLDWDKPLSQQPYIVEQLKKLDPTELNKLGINPDFTRRSTSKELTGESLYDVLTTHNSQKGASNFLAKQGISGIRYLDQGSRSVTGGELVEITKTPKGFVSKIKIENRGGAGFSTPTQQFTTSMPFKTEAEAQKWANEKIGGGTSNFVVFDPTDVQILEKNSKPVSRKELIEKQVKNLKD